MSTRDLQKILVEKLDDVNRMQDAWIAVLRPFLKSVPTLAISWVNVGSSGAPAFQNNWVNFDTTRTAGFSKDSLGWVRLRGLVKSGTVSTTVFTLPSGFRPKRNMTFVGDSNNAYQTVSVNLNGNVIQGTSAGVSNAWQFLDGIHFLAEN